MGANDLELAEWHGATFFQNKGGQARTFICVIVVAALVSYAARPDGYLDQVDAMKYSRFDASPLSRIHADTTVHCQQLESGPSRTI
jgi:hypothetical protein